MQPDWLQWHHEYRDAGTKLSARLLMVQRCIADALSAVENPEPRVVSICAGQAHDLIGALSNHVRKDSVRARLIEIDPESVKAARKSAMESGLTALEFVCGDASATDAYDGAVPADVVICCGVFGNMSLSDVKRSISFLPQLCSQGAFVIWTRHRRAPDVTPAIRRLFAQAEFSEVSFEATDRFGVGVQRWQGTPQPIQPGRRMFVFGSGLWA